MATTNATKQTATTAKKNYTLAEVEALLAAQKAELAVKNVNFSTDFDTKDNTLLMSIPLHEPADSKAERLW